MLAIKKKVQKFFKSIGYFLFKLLYGKIENIFNLNAKDGVEINSVKINNNFSYKLYKIKKARLYTDRVNDTAIIKNNEIIDGPSFQFRTNNNQLINDNIKKNLVFLNGTPRFKKKIYGSVLSLLTGGGGNENYWHWIFDVLPRLGICEKIINIKSIDFFLLPDNKKKFQIETLDILNIPKIKQISSVEYRHIQTDNLFITSHPVVLSNNATKDIQNIPDWIPEWLKTKFLKNKNVNDRNFSKMIYLDRSDSKSNVKHLRSVVNEEEVKNYLKRRGFQMIKLEELNFIDQVLIFNNADVIVGLHGAGFANLSFCKSKTKVVEFKANPLDKVIEGLALKNDLKHSPINCSVNEIKKDDQFGHVKVPLEKLDKILTS